MVKGGLNGGADRGAAVVRFENVGLRYGIGPEILKDVTFTLGRGSFSFLTGPSGAGKSSLLKLLFLALRPSRGLINLFGRDIASLRHAELPGLRRRIGVVFQDFKLLDHLSAYDNVALPLRAAGVRPESYRSNVKELLDWVGLIGQADMFPPVLSGGEKQRVAIAVPLWQSLNSSSPMSRRAMLIPPLPPASSTSSRSSTVSARPC